MDESLDLVANRQRMYKLEQKFTKLIEAHNKLEDYIESLERPIKYLTIINGIGYLVITIAVIYLYLS